MPSASPASPLDAAITSLVTGTHRDPFAILGPHFDGHATLIRAMHPAAHAVDVRIVATGELVPMARRNPAGVFEARIDGATPDYRLRVTYAGDQVVELDDPYRYGRVLTDF